jgi:formylmethanofuran dehydrogenase subunit E
LVTTGELPVHAVFLLTVRRMSQCIIICPSCEREILSDNEARRTPRGRIVCDECAQDTYLDVPLT